MDRSALWVKILNNVGWETDKPVGSIVPIPMRYATELISKGFVEIHVNNVGINQPVDEEDYEDIEFFFED